jgi:outer membrane protein assembly factor BamA
MRLRAFTLLAVAVTLASPLMAAQTKPAAKHTSNPLSAYKLIAVNVKGTHYKPEDVIAAAGLHLGDDVTEENFKTATATLGETGLFTNITYAYSYSPAGTKLDLELADNTELVPIRFENFVWYPDQELSDKLRAQLVLFEGKVPVSRSMIDQVAGVLSGLLTPRNPHLHATYLRLAPSPDSPKIDSVVFSVSGVPIEIRRLVFVGASSAFTAPLAELAKRVEGGDYVRSKLKLFAGIDARSVYLQHGCLKADFREAQLDVVSESPDKIIVDAKVPVVEGLQYKLAAIQWAGDGSFPAGKVQPLIHLSPGHPVNAIQMDGDLSSVRKLYGTQGYLKVRITPEPEFNDSESSVSYTLVVQQGDQYHLGEVDFQGVDDKAKARLREDWRLGEGEPFDASYGERFIKESWRDLPTGVHWNIKYHESVNESDKTVDVTLMYSANAA